MTLSLSAARRVGEGRGAGLRAGGEGRIPENIPDPVPDPIPDPIFDPVPDPGQSSGGGFPNGGQEDGRVGQHLWCSGSRHAFQASDPGSNPGRRNFCQFCGAYPGPRLLSRHHIS